GRGRLALAEGCRADRGHDDVLAAGVLRFDPLDPRQRDLRLRVPVRLALVLAQAQVVGDVHDRPGRDGAGDLEIGRQAHRDPRVARAATGSPTVAGTSAGVRRGPRAGTEAAAAGAAASVGAGSATPGG